MGVAGFVWDFDHGNSSNWFDRVAGLGTKRSASRISGDSVGCFSRHALSYKQKSRRLKATALMSYRGYYFLPDFLPDPVGTVAIV